MAAIELASALPERTTRDQFSRALSQLNEVLRVSGDAPLSVVADMDRRVKVLREMAGRMKAGQEAIMQIAEAQVRLCRRLGHLLLDPSCDWKVEAPLVGLSHGAGYRCRRLGAFDAEIFERALADVMAYAIPSVDAVTRRAESMARPGHEEPGWQRRWDRAADPDRWSDYGAREELEEQVTLAVGEALREGGELSIADLAQQIIAGDAELILALDPPGHEVIRERLHRARRRATGSWPVVFACCSVNVGRYTYVAFEHATVAHARADLSVKRENVLRVLSAYRRARRLVRQLEHLPESTPMTEAVGSHSEADE